jgi:hypothetical protein
LGAGDGAGRVPAAEARGDVVAVLPPCHCGRGEKVVGESDECSGDGEGSIKGREAVHLFRAQAELLFVF